MLAKSRPAVYPSAAAIYRIVSCATVLALLLCSVSTPNSGFHARWLGRRQLNTLNGIDSEGMPEKPVPDNRTLVSSTTTFPYNAVGLLQVFYASGISSSQVQGLCSGALIGPNIVLTAAHCLLDPDTGAATQAATFAPAYNPNASPRAPYGTAVMQKWAIPQAFADCVKKDAGQYSLCDQEVDFGVMLLDTSFDQYMDYSHSNSSDDGDVSINTAGYPADEGACGNFARSGDSSGCAMYYTSCTGDGIPPGAAYDTFPCYGYDGQSGSPVWQDDAKTGNVSITGVVINGDDEEGQIFTILTQQVYDELQGLIAQLMATLSPLPVTA